MCSKTVAAYELSCLMVCKIQILPSFSMCTWLLRDDKQAAHRA